MISSQNLTEVTRLVGQTGLRLAAAKGPNGWVILPGQGARHRLAYNERLCHRLPVAYNDRRKISSSSSGVSTIGFPCATQTRAWQHGSEAFGQVQTRGLYPQPTSNNIQQLEPLASRQDRSQEICASGCDQSHLHARRVLGLLGDHRQVLRCDAVGRQTRDPNGLSWWNRGGAGRVSSQQRKEHTRRGGPEKQLILEMWGQRERGKATNLVTTESNAHHMTVRTGSRQKE